MIFACIFSVSLLADESPDALHSKPVQIDEWMNSIPLVISGAQYCTGVLIDSRTVATAYHCVVSGREPMLEWDDGKQEVASIVAVHPKKDLALLQIQKTSRPILSVRKEHVQRGEKVWALGHPFAPFATGNYQDVLRWSVSQGVISNTGKDLIQTDTALNPGNSGGPLVDQNGAIVGIVSHKMKAENLSFAIPSAAVLSLQKKPRKPSWMGGEWFVYPAASMGLQYDTLSSFDVCAALLFRDRFALRYRHRLPFESLERAEERGRILLFPISISSLGRFRLGRGASSLVLELGPMVVQNQDIRYENEQYLITDDMHWGGELNVEIAGVRISFDGMVLHDEFRFFMGFSTDLIGYRGVF